MTNLSRILKTAWHNYRFQLRNGAEKSPALWSEMLKSAWRQERDRVALEAERQRRYEMSQSTDPETIRAYRIEAIQNELDTLKYCNGPIAMRQAALRAELTELEAEPQDLAVAA